MKNIYWFISILIVCGSCKNVDLEPKSDCIEVRIVGGLCGTTVLQVVDGEVEGKIADTWTDTEGNTYSNVFTTFYDTCDPAYLNRGETFFVRIIDENRVDAQCGYCRAYIKTPKEYFNTVIVTECATPNN